MNKEVKYTVTKHYGDIEIKFYPRKHGFQLMGHRDYLLGVTSCTGIIDKSAALLVWAGRLTRDYLLEQIKKGNPVTELMLEEAINQHKVQKEEAGDIGHQVHAWAEDYIAGRNPVVPENENVRNGVLSFLKWVKQEQPKFLFSEKVVYSKRYNYVGICDVAFQLKSENYKVNHIGDFKTSKSVYPEMVAQISAYQNAEAEEHGTKWGDKYLLRFDKLTGNFESHRFPEEDHKAHFEVFLQCLEIKKFLKEWEAGPHGYYANKKK